MKLKSSIQAVLLVLLAIMTFEKLDAQVISDSFTGTDGTALSSHAPNTNLTGAGWNCPVIFSSTPASSALLGNAAYMNHFGNAAIKLASNGTYTKPTQITLSADLNPGTLTTDGNPWNGEGLGFWNVATLSTSQDFFNFLGLILGTDGTLSLIQFDGVWGHTTIGSTAYSLGTFNENSVHTLKYTVSTSTGAISNISLTDSNGTQTYSFTTTIFTDANTLWSGFLIHGSLPGKTGTVDNFTLSGPSGSGLNFSFTLPAPYNTSAGVFDTSGNLVRTLWRGVPYLAGTYSGSWDGKNDAGTLLGSGTYTVKLLYHNVRYAWDGVMGNTFNTFTGNVYGFQGIPSQLAIDGTNAFLANGYTEGDRLIKRFSTTAPNISNGVQVKDYQVDFQYIATDGTTYYVANDGSSADTTKSTFVTAYNVSNDSAASFTSGTSVTISPPTSAVFPSCIDVDQTNIATHGATGLAVQKTGNVLAVAHGPLNTVSLYNKTSGASLGSISVTDPVGLAFAPTGDLWVLTGTTSERFTGVGSTNTLATTISGFSQPLSIAVHPSNADIVLVADGGTNQRVMAYNSTGTALWTYGVAGGYDANGAAVANNKFQFAANYPVPLAVQSDGSFWVRDSATMRILHISSALAYLEQIASVWGDAYTTTVDPNHPSRVIASGWLEYQVDYTKPLQPGDPQATGGNASWKLVNNWTPLRSLTQYTGFSFQGLATVVTLSNGRTYGLCDDSVSGNLALVELPATGGLRFTGTEYGYNYSLYANGDLRHYDTAMTGGNLNVYKQPLTGFDASGNPQWGGSSLLASAPAGPLTPGSPSSFAGTENARFPVTSSNVMVSLNPTGNSTNSGMHLGGIQLGSTQWRWQGSPSISTEIPFDGIGSFDIGDGIQYAANRAEAVGHNIVYGFHGEFWNGSEADQFVHFFDDGLFVGQFGTSGDVTTYTAPPPTVPDDGGTPGKGGNAFSPTLIQNGSEFYLWHNDESQHNAVHRWHLVGANAIQEMSAAGSWGSSLTLSAASVAYPTALVATPSSGQVALTWASAAGAGSYNVKYSTQPGGPYTVISGVTATNYTVTGLTNDTPYYFSVSGVIAGVESVNSYEARSAPFDTTSAVHVLGQAWSVGSVNHFAVTSANVGTGKFAMNLHSMFSTLGLPQTTIGSNGYAIFDWDGAGTNKINLATGYTVTVNSGWQSMARYLEMPFVIDGVNGLTTGDAGGLHANPTGSIDIVVPDSNWHVLSVFAADESQGTRNDVYTLTPHGLSTPSAVVNIVEPTNNLGFNHLIQYKFKGNVTLTVHQNSNSNQSASVTGITID